MMGRSDKNLSKILNLYIFSRSQDPSLKKIFTPFQL